MRSLLQEDSIQGWLISSKRGSSGARDVKQTKQLVFYFLNPK